jgi:hypothetical protein
MYLFINAVTFILVLGSVIPLSAQTSRKSEWIPDNGDGTYKNPIIFADYSDPDVIRVGDDFYLTASSFNSIPGLPILHSKDLVNWKIISHALRRQPPDDVFSPMVEFVSSVTAVTVEHLSRSEISFSPGKEFGSEQRWSCSL